MVLQYGKTYLSGQRRYYSFCRGGGGGGGGAHLPLTKNKACLFVACVDLKYSTIKSNCVRMAAGLGDPFAQVLGHYWSVC